ncbi:hypothetical protein PVAND_016614 [Polypedilum vanderplanki]|uniref:Uncharacterized protein n=1 Tax=Polypedilum vanderplanki TaxID=319348 RepID=A0A9J6BFX9_POLVA|nr:hypothetical protein PVAND_016614 [Polypedilum vanderplanki]
MKINLFLVSCLLLNLTFIISKRSYTSPDAYWVYFKQFKCEITEQGKISDYIYNLTCFAKSWSRNHSTMNAIAYLKKPMQSPFISASIAYKYGTIYREIINLPRYNVCNIHELSKNNLLIRHIYKVFTILTPGLIKECPYYNIKMINATLNGTDPVGMFAQGDYRGYVFFYDSPTGNALYKITSFVTVNSPFKESYGK